MSLKDLFGKKSTKILTSTNFEDLSKDVESSEYIVQELEERKLIKPDIDYTDPKNFAFFGSANKYYTDSIESITKKYPYDGSSAEKLKWTKTSSDLQNYIFENEYPRNNGYVSLGFVYGATSSVSTDDYSNPINKEYISIKGGPNTAPNMDTFKVSNLFGTSNILEPLENRESNLLLDGNTGATIEFWLKKNDLNGSSKQVIFDLWNSSSFGTDYGRFRVEIHPGLVGEENKFFVELSSGSNGISNFSIGQNLSISSGSWQHYSLSAINSGSNIEFKLFQNGILNEKAITGSTISRVYGPMLGWIGSLGTQVSGGNADLGYGKLSGSLDEFRYWKCKRTEKEISRFWFTDVNGGTNTDTANTNLGVYYKFNEGIYSLTSTDTKYDNKVLDYSGRFSNGYWTGYVSGSRSTNSAIVESNAANTEVKDPVIYLTHPDVQALLIEKQEIGTLHDNNNSSMIYYTIPAWIVEGDQENDSNKLYELTQIIGSYFDELFIKIKYLPSIKEVSYKNGRAFPYAMKLLESMGFMTQDLFTNSSILENLGNRNENVLYEERLFNIKNHIYQNIYNNLSYIQKSKGTEKSIRNLLRCFGVDEELIKLNIYSNDSVYTFDDRFLNTYYKKKLINFNDQDRVQGTVYQMTSSLDSNSRSFIAGDTELAYHGSTLEAEIVIPLTFSPSEKFYFPKNFLTSSVLGIHSANTLAPGDTTWFGSDLSNLEVYIVKPDMDSSDGYFQVTSSYLGINLTSSFTRDLYANQKWNIAIKLKHEKYPNSLKVIGADVGDYLFEFYAINTIQDFIQDEIYLTASVPQATAENYFADSKRIYAGSHRQNFTGSIIHNSDIKLSSVRYWLSYLDNSIIQQHAKDPIIFGQNSPISNIETLYSGGLNELPQQKTLALHWDFNLVTGSDNGSGVGPTNSFDAKFQVLDITSGSLTNEYGIIGQIVNKAYTAVGDFFFRNNSDMVENGYITIAKHRLPENMMNSDLINILNQDDETFTRDSRPVNYYFALEKSMYQTISEEMIRFFGTITEFNNIIGKPQYRYEREYRELVKLREMFFQGVSNSPDLEKYVDYFKWIDGAITKMTYQLIPASADFSPDISDVVESHVLERNKYAWKLPSIELGAEPPISSVKTIGELKYNWKYGHAPIPLVENTNCIWWKERKERESSLNGIFQVLSTEYKKKFTRMADFGTDIQIYVNKNPSNIEVIKPITKIGSGGYLEIDVLKVIEKKDCSDK
jgi:hypothetical protein